MKATELMVGDFVIVKDYGIREIIGIRDFDGVVEISENEDSEIEIPYDNISPIPLTPEILEKNGWEKSIGENPVEVWTIGKGAYLHKTDNGYKLREGAEFNVPNIQYVHTLQQALRLCGHNDLADGFKI